MLGSFWLGEKMLASVEGICPMYWPVTSFRNYFMHSGVHALFKVRTFVLSQIGALLSIQKPIYGMIFYIIRNKKRSLCRILKMNSIVIPTFNKSSPNWMCPFYWNAWIWAYADIGNKSVVLKNDVYLLKSCLCGMNYSNDPIWRDKMSNEWMF
jgi:hypothetical protein